MNLPALTDADRLAAPTQIAVCRSVSTTPTHTCRLEVPPQDSGDAMSLSELVKLVPPPIGPIDRGSQAVWEETQVKLRLRLPRDYYEYGMAYGSGDMLNGTMQVFNWASPYYERQVLTDSRSIRIAGEDSPTRMAVFPDTPGLLTWGRYENGASLCWFTEGVPDTWPVIIQSLYGNCFRFDHSMTEFLVNLFTGKITCPVWQEPFTEADMVFVPRPK